MASASALAPAVRERRVSSYELVTACLDCIEAWNPALNAVVQLRAEAALRDAQDADDALAGGEPVGPLHGVPMTIKDSLDTAGVVTTAGTTGRARFVPERDATVVARLRAAGAILLGKTNTPELTLSFETSNLVYGRTSNPYDTARTCGGSSGGAAAIVAAGGSAFDIGSDFGGSIRHPCHCCGIAGIKPTSGRVPRTGHALPFGGPLDVLQQLGPMARRVADLELLLKVIAGSDWIDPAIVDMPLRPVREVDLGTLRVAVHSGNGIAVPTPETAAAVEAAAAALAPAVRSLVHERPPGIEQSLDLLMALSRADGGAAIRRLLAHAGTTEHTQKWLEEARPLSAADADALHARWDRFRCDMLAFMADYDVVLCPVNAQPALHHRTTADHLDGFSYTMTWNLTGWPAAVVRGGTSADGLPIGVQVVARPWREDVALAVAARIESEPGGFVPPERR